jgi:hypothetical protein
LAFALAALAAAIGVVASALMGQRYVHSEKPELDEVDEDDEVGEGVEKAIARA